MHLSLLSDTRISHGASAVHVQRHVGASSRAHLDGLVRGLVFLIALSVPLGLALATGHAGQHDPSAGYAQTFDASR